MALLACSSASAQISAIVPCDVRRAETEAFQIGRVTNTSVPYGVEVPLRPGSVFKGADLDATRDHILTELNKNRVQPRFRFINVKISCSSMDFTARTVD